MRGTRNGGLGVSSTGDVKITRGVSFKKQKRSRGEGIARELNVQGLVGDGASKYLCIKTTGLFQTKSFVWCGGDGQAISCMHDDDERCVDEERDIF